MLHAAVDVAALRGAAIHARRAPRSILVPLGAGMTADGHFGVYAFCVDGYVLTSYSHFVLVGLPVSSAVAPCHSHSWMLLGQPCHVPLPDTAGAVLPHTLGI